MWTHCLFSGTKLVTRLKTSTQSSHENAADGTTSRRDNAEQDEADLTGSAEIGEATGSAEKDEATGSAEIGEATGNAKIGGEARAQTDAAGPALGATTAVPQVSNSLISQPAKHLPAATAVKKRYQNP